MLHGRLNLFQRLIRQWELLHPYNAAQVLHIVGDAEPAALSATWNQTLHAFGIGPVRIEGKDFFCRPHEPADVPLLFGMDLDNHLAAALNVPFAEDELPLRPFILPAEDNHYLGVVYRHCLADSASIRSLLREWFVRRYDATRVRQSPSVNPAGGYWHYMGPRRGGWSITRAAANLVRWTIRLKRARRMSPEGFADLTQRFALHHQREGWIEALHQRTRSCGVTLNDAFLAAMAIACDRHLRFEYAPHRPNLALGTIVDLRSGRAELDDVWTLLLGFKTNLVRPAELTDFSALLASVARQTKRNNRSAAAAASGLRLGVGRLCTRRMDAAGQLEFYRKRMPLAAGISNINLNRTWAAEFHPDVLLDYIRVSPTGPMLPLVFTPSTLGQRFHFGLTWRPALVDDDRAARVAETFVEVLEAFERGK